MGGYSVVIGFHDEPVYVGVPNAVDMFVTNTKTNWISNGYPGSQMPAFITVLTDLKRWDLLNYIRILAK